MELGDIEARLSGFVRDRDWEQFHTPENLAKSISIEAAELLEHFQWGDEPNLDELKDELADVITYCILLAKKYDWDINEIVNRKITKNEAKYPVEKSKGNSKKYDQL